MTEKVDKAPQATVPGPGASLQQEQLDGADLKGADLTRTTLDQVSLKGADLRGARLCGATLIQVDLSDAQLEGADLSGARLEKVVLDGAVLDGVDARGAYLEQTSLDRVRARGLQAAGVEMVKVNAAEIEFDGAVLDGAKLSDVAIHDAVFRELSAVGLRASDCALVKSVLEGCDLAGAGFEDSTLQAVELRGGSLRGLALVGSKLRNLRSTDAVWGGASIQGCRGLSAELEAELEAAGAVLRHSPAVRLLRRIKGSRPLQIGLLVAVLLLITAIVVAVKSPGLWPSAVLLSRFQALESRNDVERCEPLIEVAAALAGRADLEPGLRFRSLHRAAECQLQLGQDHQVEATLQRFRQLGDELPEHRHQALQALGDLLISLGQLDEAQALVEPLREAGDEPELLLESLRFEARLFEARGVTPIPSARDGERADDPWRSLQLELADALLKLPELAPHHLGSTAADLLVSGDWERALQLMDAVEPALEPEERWEQARSACDHLRELGAPDLALALLEALHGDEPLDDLADIDRLGLFLDLHRQLGLGSEAEEMLAAIEAPADPRLALELSLLRAGLATEQGRPADALALLESAEFGPDWPFDLRARLAWTQADAHLASGDEAGAVAALEPALVAVNDKEPAENLLRELANFMERLTEPQRVTAMLERVDNPMLDKAGQGQELALTVSRAMARAGTLTMDDPTLLGVLERGTSDQVQEAARLLLDIARGQGRLEEAVERLGPRARALADRRSRENLGMMLAEVCAGEGSRERALELIDELSLDQAEDLGVRSRAVGLRVGLAVDDGQLESALERYRSAVADSQSIESWVVINLGRRLVDALQAKGRMKEALALVEELRSRAPDQPELWQEAMTCRLAMDDAQGLEGELTAARSAIGACLATIAVTRARLELGKSAIEVQALEEACSSAPSSAAQRLDAAAVAGQAGHPEAALSLAQAASELELAPELWVRVQRELAGFTAATGARQAAVDGLDAAYDRAAGPEQQRQISEALFGQLTGLGDPEPILAAYRRLAADHPAQIDEAIWKQAALALIHAGHPTQVDELGGDPGWRHTVSRELDNASYAALVEQGDADGAWAWLEEALARDASAEARAELVHRAAQLADRTGTHERLQRWLDLLEDRVDEGSSLLPLLQLKRARALEAGGDARGVVEALQPVLRTMPAELEGELWSVYGRNLGRADDAAAIQAVIASQLAEGVLAEPTEARLRLVAAEELHARGESADAVALLEALEGRALEPGLASSVLDLMARCYTALERYDDALTLPVRFQGAARACEVWLAVVLHLPPDQGAAERARTAALEHCAPEDIPQHQVLALGDAIARSDPERALLFLGQARAVQGLEAEQQRGIDIERARLLAELERTDEARALLEQVLEGAQQPHLATRAVTATMRLILRQGAEDAAAQVQEVAERGLERVAGNPQATRELLRETAGALGELGAFDEAIGWQLRLVDQHAEPDEGRGYALLQLIHLQLDARPGEPDKADPAWLAQLDEARALAKPGTHLYDELLTLSIAWKVVQAGSEARIIAMLEAETQGLDNDTNLLNSVAARLDVWRHEGARVVRTEREARLQP